MDAAIRRMCVLVGRPAGITTSVSDAALGARPALCFASASHKARLNGARVRLEMTSDKISRLSRDPKTGELVRIGAPGVAMWTPDKRDNSPVVGRKPLPGEKVFVPWLRDDLPAYVTCAEVARALDVATPAVRSLIAFLWGTGARVSEALAVRPQDLDVQRRMVKVPTLKRRRKDGTGRKVSASRVIAMAGHTMTPVLAYIVDVARAPGEPIWSVGRQHAWRIVGAALGAAGVEDRRAKPHALRHGHAVHAVLAGVPLNLIQRQLGHASIVTTAIYLRVTGQDVREAYDRVTW
jgi:integrase